MQIGWGQLLFIGFLVFLLFGNLPKLIKDLTKGIQQIEETQKDSTGQTSKDSHSTPSKGALAGKTKST